MSLKTVSATKMKLEKGAKVEGYLLSAELNKFDGDNGPVSLTKIALKVPTGDVVTLNLGDSTYATILVPGLWTVVTKEITETDGKEGTKTVVQQDDAKKISV